MTLPVDVAPPARLVAPLPPDATAGGLAFHRLVFARRRAGWWTPIVTGLLGAAFWVVLLILVMVVVVIAALVDPGLAESLFVLDPANTAIDFTDPLTLIVMLGTIVLLLPAYLLASLIVNGPRVGLISSAAGRLRWRWMLLCTGVASAISVVLAALSLLFPQGAHSGAPASENPQLWVVLVLLVVLVPFQAAAEEYVFRGYLMQAIGRWLRHPLFAILLPVPLFVLGHMYDLLGQIGVGLFAVAAGWLTWRTGGLEAAIALHVVNNLAGFLLGLATGTDPTASEQGIVSLLFSVLLIGGFVAITEVLFRRSGMGRTLVLSPPTPPTAGAAPAVWAPPPGAHAQQ